MDAIRVVLNSTIADTREALHESVEDPVWYSVTAPLLAPYGIITGLRSHLSQLVRR